MIPSFECSVNTAAGDWTATLGDLLRESLPLPFGVAAAPGPSSASRLMMPLDAAMSAEGAGAGVVDAADGRGAVGADAVLVTRRCSGTLATLPAGAPAAVLSVAPM